MEATLATGTDASAGMAVLAPAPTGPAAPPVRPGWGPELLPLDAGEQYRFTFSAESCIGCHSCEVACAEQNDLPVEVAWRKVGELEAGAFPGTRRLTISMACNHCLEPTCLSGCPTNAYVKLATGSVSHRAEECIGCQYCIWNCPYEAPVFDRSRGIVTKCDMCQPRLEAGQAPACVSACPTHAIGVQKVNVAAWRLEHGSADAPGLPPSDITLSTTRIELPSLPAMVPVSEREVRPEDPHWPLIALTLLTQLSLGSVAALVLLQRGGAPGGGAEPGGGAALGAFLPGAVALGASLFHLGRPAHALKALRNLRTSWLSREVLFLGLFSLAAFAYALSWSSAGSFIRWGRPALGHATIALGIAGVYSSGRLYLVPARPVWNSPRTLVGFFASAAAAGPLLALLLVGDWAASSGTGRVLLVEALLGTVTQLVVLARLAYVSRRRLDRQHQGTA
ncbi:MAG: DmsC/YnfH family molybdoenzyme membrane anchor subunit, partial [Acidimicrobiia bacterium]